MFTKGLACINYHFFYIKHRTAKGCMGELCCVARKKHWEQDFEMFLTAKKKKISIKKRKTPLPLLGNYNIGKEF